jgi:YD repeat-containing protein
MKTTITLCLLATTIILTTNCKKHKPAAPETPGAPEVNNPDEPSPKQAPLPLKITHKGIIYNFNYLNNSEKIAEITLSNGHKWQFTHKPEKQVFWIQLYNSKDLYAEIDYTYNDKGQGIKATTFSYENRVYTPENKYTFEYNSLDQLSKINSNDHANKPISDKTITYTTNPATTTYTTKVAGKTTEETTYTHDNKNGIFKNIQHTNLMPTYFDPLFFHCHTNNITSITTTNQTTTNITYQYNAENYPTKATITKGKTTEEMTITYTTIDKP